MKKIVLAIAVLFAIAGNTFAQVEKQIQGEAMNAAEKKKMDDTLNGWKFGGMGGLTFNQAGFKNWAPGGVNSFSMLFNLRLSADYKKGKHLWQNWAAAEYGLQFIKGDYFKVRKNADRWEIFSKYGYKVYKPLYVAAYADLRSQFSKSYTYADTTKTLTSRFASPLTFEAAIGLDYVPNAHFSLFASPLAAKIVYVGDDAIAMAGTFGNAWPKKHRDEFGAVLIATYKQDFWKQNISILSVFKVYKNYLRSDYEKSATINSFDNAGKKHYRQNFDIDWQTTLGLKVNNWLSASVFMQLVYDNDVIFAKDANNITSTKAQFRDVIGVGLTYQTNYFKAKGEKAKKL